MKNFSLSFYFLNGLPTERVSLLKCGCWLTEDVLMCTLRFAPPSYPKNGQERRGLGERGTRERGKRLDRRTMSARVLGGLTNERMVAR